MDSLTHGSHQTTYDAVFQHPVARNLAWRDVRSMLGSIVVDAQHLTPDQLLAKAREFYAKPVS